MGNEKKDGSITARALTPARERPPTANKLSPEHRQQVYQLLASGYRNTTILAYIKATFGIKVSRQSINAMRHNNPHKMEAGRKEVEREIRLAAPIAGKINRLAKRQELINKPRT